MITQLKEELEEKNFLIQNFTKQQNDTSDIISKYKNEVKEK